MGSVVGQPALELAERVAETAKGLGIETAVIGALALAAHGYVRGTVDVDLASSVDPGSVLRALQDKLREGGLKTRLLLPDAEDPLGGMLRTSPIPTGQLRASAPRPFGQPPTWIQRRRFGTCSSTCWSR
ncbi:MAG: hypothetical protein KC933_00280 [Myxococcales bacterium]|nr:hypothetical protein [Myxococcales bacterium]MCB9649559.1 hypothetical protein [Deltaproteobacteria bacterium]